jgi:putative MATE family efflux protein
VLLLAISFTIGGLLVVRPFFEKMGASEVMLPYVLEYITVILYGAFFQFFAMIGNGMLRGEGDTVTPMLMMMFGTLVNIILDPLLIFGIGPFSRMGVQGAALATITAQAVSCVILIFSYIARRNVVKPTFKIFRIDKHLLAGILMVGGPAIIAQILQPVSMGLLFFLLKAYGDASKAALTMNITYQQLAILPVIGLAAGTLAMTGQNYGAKKFERIRSIAVRANMVSAILLIVVAAIFILGSTPFVRVFSKMPDVVAIGTTLLIIASLSLPFVGIRILTASMMQGMGMGFRSLTINISQVGLAIPLAWLMSFWLGINGIWWGLTVGNALSALVGSTWIWLTVRTLERSQAIA